MFQCKNKIKTFLSEAKNPLVDISLRFIWLRLDFHHLNFARKAQHIATRLFFVYYVHCITNTNKPFIDSIISTKPISWRCGIVTIAFFSVLLTMLSVLPFKYCCFILTSIITITCFQFHLLVDYFSFNILEGITNISAAEFNSIIQSSKLHCTAITFAMYLHPSNDGDACYYYKL